jgi:hypothetical protein
VFENKMLKAIFASKGNEMIWGWRKLHDEELHYFYSSQHVIEMR